MSQRPTLDITIASDPDYERVVAEIYADDQFVALISQDEGPDNLKIVFPETAAAGSNVARSVFLDWFLNAIEEARNELLRR